MSEMDFIPQTKVRPTTSTPCSIKTPVLITRKNCRAHASIHSNVQVIQSTPPDGSHTAILKQLYMKFSECLNQLLTHNCATNNFRDSLSNNNASVQRLFFVFLSASTRVLGTIPVLQKGVSPSDVIPKSVKQESIMPFLKAWKRFATRIIEFQDHGPESISRTVETNFQNIQYALDIISKSLGVSPTTVHTHTPGVVHTLINQKNSLAKEAKVRLFTPSDIEGLKDISLKVKIFSRIINECFTKEFSSMGIAGNELVRIRTLVYTSCSDIISCLRGAYMFNLDMQKLLSAMDELQMCLENVLVRFGLPCKYIYIRNTVEDVHNTPRADEEEGNPSEENSHLFDSCEGFDDLLKSFESFVDSGTYSESSQLGKLCKIFVERLKLKYDVILNNNKDLQNIISDKEKAEYDMREKHREEINLRKDRIAELTAKVEELHQKIRDQEKELDYFRNKKHDNEFKQALRNVARKLGGVLNEEEVNFDDYDDEDDDQIISKVDALTVYVIERKCQQCILHKRQEMEMRAMLSTIIDPDEHEEEEIELPKLIEMAKKKYEVLISQCRLVVAQREDMINQNIDFQRCLEKVGDILGFPVDDYLNLEKISEVATKYVNENNNKLQKAESASDYKSKQILDTIIDTYENFIKFAKEATGEDYKTKEIFNSETRTIDDRLNDIQEQSNIIQNLLSRSIYRHKECENMLHQVVERISKFINEHPPPGFVLDVVSTLLYLLETKQNPLLGPLRKAEELNNFYYSKVEIITNRLFGMMGEALEKKDEHSTPQINIANAVKLLDKFHDMH